MKTTGNPQGGPPGDDASGADQPGNDGYGGEPPDEYGHSGGDGYGPGSGDPDGGPGHNYGPAYVGSGPGYPGDGGPAHTATGAAEPALPAVAATPALKGYPGGPGLQPLGGGEDGPPGTEARILSSPSVWHSAQQTWRQSGVDWQRPAGDYEPAEAEWERVATAPSGRGSPLGGAAGPSARQAARVSVPSLAGESGSLAGTGAADRGHPAAPATGGALRHRRGPWLLAGTIVVVAALVAGGLVLSSRGPKAASGPLYPPAVLAGSDITAHPAQLGRGVFQSVTGVAASSGTVVAVGSEVGQWLPRAEFLVSADGGRSWRLAAVRTAGGGVSPSAGLPQLVAAGPDGWVALGTGAAWTSRTGRTWTSAPVAFPLQAGDQVAALTGTSQGFIAVGDNVPKGNPARRNPVLWTSPNGLAWQRLSGSRLGLPAPGGRVLRIRDIAARGGDVLLYGSELATARKGKHRVTSVQAALWRSGDAGSTWAATRLPLGAGGSHALDGIAATGTGFVAIRPRTSKAAGSGAITYSSPDGTSWRQAGTITTARPAGLAITMVRGSDQGVVAAGQLSSGARVAFVSADGSSWRSVASLGAGLGGSAALTGVTLTTGGTVVAGGSSTSGPLGQAPYLVLAGPGRPASAVSFARIPGATGPALAVNGIGVAGNRQVAVGTADGLPAIWSAAGGQSSAGQPDVSQLGVSQPRVNQHWAPASSAALDRPGLSTLGGVAHGRAGWLAVGSTVNGPSVRPIVVGSANGTSWQAVDSGLAFAGPGISLHAAAAGRGGYVTVGQQVVPATTTITTTGSGRHKKVIKHVVPAHTIAAAWWSSGLTGWRRAAGLGAVRGARQMAAVTAYGSGFVAVGSSGRYPAAWTSPNGRNWQFVQLGPPPGASAALLQQVAVRGNLIVATGTQTTPSGTAPFAEYTTDGGTLWQQEPLTPAGGRAAADGPTAVTGLAAAGRGFVAVGTAGPPGGQRVVVWWSTTGFSWKMIQPRGTGLTSPGSQAITAITANGPALTAAGYLATPQGEQPTLWNATAGP